MPDYIIRQRDRGQAEAKCLRPRPRPKLRGRCQNFGSRPLWPRGLNITGVLLFLLLLFRHFSYLNAPVHSAPYSHPFPQHSFNLGRHFCIKLAFSGWNGTEIENYTCASRTTLASCGHVTVVGSRAASFRGPLLSDWVSANLMLNILETKQYRGFVFNRKSIGKCPWRVDW